jgi:RNA recognition motif-containing protein
MRPVNHTVLGTQCRIEYANDYPKYTSINDQLQDQKTIVVTKIPGNFTEKDLYSVFGNCYITGVPQIISLSVFC